MAAHARRSLAGALGGAVSIMSRLRWLIAGALGVISAILLAQIVTYAVAAEARAPRTIAGLLPPVSRCPDVLVSGNWLEGLTPPQRRAAEDLLKARFTKIYLDELDIPPSARVYDSNGGDVVWLVELKGVCDFAWFIDSSGPFWFKAVYSTDMGLQYRGGARITYIWLVFKWVEVNAEIGWHA